MSNMIRCMEMRGFEKGGIQLLDKNKWLNLILGVFSFYTIFSVLEVIMGHYGNRVISVAPGSTEISENWYWLISFIVALTLSLLVIIFFCRPRAPIFVGLAVLIGGCLAMFPKLYSTIIHLDKYFRQEGTSAALYLLPHVVIIVGALIALYIAWLSNRIGAASAAATA